MADKVARTHSHQSNRAKPKDGREKKVVFKGVLDSPFRIQWPSIPLNLQNSILAQILELLSGAAEFHAKKRALSRKRKREEKHAGGSAKKKAKNDDAGMDVDKTLMKTDEKEVPAPAPNPVGVDLDMTPASPTLGSNATNVDPPKADGPYLMHHITFGINAVTKRLETQVQNARRPSTTIPASAAPPPPPPPLQYIFVCRADVDPTLLVDHLPHLVAGFNSARPTQPVKLVPLPKGAELALSEALAVRRVAVLAVDVDFEADATLKTLLEPTPVLTASWLTPAQDNPSLIPTHIKLLKTTAPKDMKEAKETRMQGKAAANQRKAEQKASAKGKTREELKVSEK